MIQLYSLSKNDCFRLKILISYEYVKSQAESILSLIHCLFYLFNYKKRNYKILTSKLYSTAFLVFLTTSKYV